MGIVILQILQWILRIILFLLLLLLVLIAIVLIVPIRYQVEGEFLEKKPGGRGKITWFFYLIYMTFAYEDDFRIQVRVFGFKVFDSTNNTNQTKSKNKSKETAENVVEKTSTNGEEVKENLLESQESVTQEVSQNEDSEKTLEARNEEKVISENKNGNLGQTGKNVSKNNEQWQDNVQSLEQSQNDFQDTKQNQGETLSLEDNINEKEKKSFSEKVEGIKSKIQDIIQKIKDIIAKIQEGKLKVEHYLELWNRKETQITFSRAKTKLGRMIKAVLPRKWKLTGEIGFSDPCTTGQFMGVLGAMYPILGNKVQIVPNFENEVMNIEGSVKGHIRLGNLLYQLVSLILNRHCFKFIKLVLDELSSSKKSKKET